MAVDNLVIDGLQLAIRCATVPGLCELKDSHGRPTGAVLGFLQSLISLRKRFPGAVVHVTWDGSSKRRKKTFPAYKANRSSSIPVSFETEWLRRNLPKLGILQTWNPEEEADDVIATLLRGPLKGHTNVFVSTDRDLLQLVTASDFQFVPAVGSGKERLYDIPTVVGEYGVRPEVLPNLRALSGDTSDNIPGVPGFGLKTASKLVRLYGSVERLFSSNMAGVTAQQHANLRGSEKQVRMNVGLMTLLTDIPLTTLPADPDQIAAREQLTDVNIKPDPILASFFSGAWNGPLQEVSL